jgi:branched-chain amino acid aminotransferase
MPQAERRSIWIDGKLVPAAEARVSVYDHGLLYGDGVFEGLRAYGGRVFKMASHLRRLRESAERIRLSIPYTADELGAAVKDTMAACGMSDCYIRLVVTRGAGTLGLHPFRCPHPCVFVVVDTIQLYPKELYESGMKVIVARRPRIPVECLDPAIKSLNYLNNILAKIEAIDAQVLEAIMLNTQGRVCECTGDNIFAVRGKQLLTPPESEGLLHGITRQYVIEDLAPALGLTVAQPTMSVKDFESADEVFLTGTAAEIVGVSGIGDVRIGAGCVGPVTKSLEAEFRRRIGAGAPEN